MHFVDSHCHLNFNSFQDDLEQVVERARDNGVTKIVVPGVDLETSQQAVALADRYPEVFAAVGIHPNDAHTWDSEISSKITSLAKHPKVVAIGEIGLDYFHADNPPQEVQQEVLFNQLELATNLNLPVILHSRSAIDELLQALAEWRLSVSTAGLPTRFSGVLHSFEGSAAQAKLAFENGFLLGIGGPITYKRSEQKRAMLAEMPLDAILLETDAPFLPPHPHRGQRNEPGYIPIIAATIADHLMLPLAEIEEKTTNNSDLLFLWNQLT